MAEDARLIKTEKNAVFELVEKSGLNPAIFTWDERKHEEPTSVITSKPASHDHFKTGQAADSELTSLYFTGWAPGKSFFNSGRFRTPLPIYTVGTWAEDMATQGCDQSADPGGRNDGAA